MNQEPAFHTPKRHLQTALAFFFLFLVAGMAWATGGEQLSPQSLQVVLDNNYPPYVFRSGDGSIQGILIDQWRLFEKKTGIHVNLSPMDWADALQGMKAGQFDVIDTIFKNPERQGWLDFTEPYARLEVPAFFNSQISGISGTASLKGFAVAAKEGDDAVNLLRSHGVDSLILFNGYEEIIRAAMEHKVNVFVVDKPPALYFLHKFGIERQFKESAPLNTGHFHRAVKKGDKQTLQLITKGFQQITPLERQEIEERWIGITLPRSFHTRVFPYILIATGFIILLIAGLFVWNASLRKAVAHRTRALRTSEERYRQLFNAGSDAIVVIDVETLTHIEVNKAAADLYGYSHEELLELRPTDLSAEPEETRLQAQSGEGTVHIPLRYHKKRDGTIFPVEIVARFFQLDGRKLLLAAMRDISERLRAEEEQSKLRDELAQARKMESIGRLAGGIAHDFNNMLGVILGHTELALVRVPAQDPLYTGLAEINKAARRSAELTRRLLAFARKQTVIPKVLDLNDIVDGMADMLKRLMGEDIDFVWAPAADLWPVKIDPSQIDQILANLCANARDAITNVGKVTISTANKSFTATTCTHHEGCREGDYVMLSIRDTGSGMENDVLVNLFEPFYTTKDVGKGTGLGLATVYGIVQQNRGFIVVDSEPGQGSCFAVFLPRYTDQPPVRATDTAAEKPAVGSETILVVEDEPAILGMTCEMLKQMGYQVLTAGSPAEGLRQASEYQGKIDLLLTDVIMPVMNGWELAGQLRERQPSLKLLFTSGYTADVIADHNVLDENVQFIQKPFTMQELSSKVRTALTS
ncbi:MAG: transporter substrate-binding domain-containing protein [Desulforhopalus sp.]|nr:transporter substrate-binding domain-containing protein [Desulforhopalus sp.]